MVKAAVAATEAAAYSTCAGVAGVVAATANTINEEKGDGGGINLRLSFRLVSFQPL